MAPKPRGRPRKNNQVPGNTRTDAALDAMRPYGFDEQLVRETVKELLEVYDGTQGWPFIEECSYKLLIETLLSKQQASSEDKDDNAIREGETATSEAPPSCSNPGAGSPNLVAQDSPLACPQTNDVRVPAPLGNTKFDDVASTEFQVEEENERTPLDNAIGSNNRNVDAKKVRFSLIRSSQPYNNVPAKPCKPCYGWIEVDTDDEVATQSKVEAENKRMPVDKSIGHNIKNVNAKQVMPMDKSIGSNIKNVNAKQVKPPGIQSSLPHHNVSIKWHEPPYGRIESDKNAEVPTRFRVKAEKNRMPVDKSIRSNIKNVDSKQVRPPVIQHSEPCVNVSIKMRKPCHGWYSSASSDGDLIRFHLPLLPEELIMSLRQNGAPKSASQRRRKSRWDEKPDDVIS